jgi:hypothetical protein
MTSPQKAKGNGFERIIAKHLSKIFDSNFTRVPTSGAMTGGMNAHVLEKLTDSQKLLLEGDIIPPDHLYNMKIECKAHKNFSFAKLFSRNKQLDDWITQAWSDEKVWFLIFKINNQGTHLCFGRDVFNKCDELKNRNYLVYNKDMYITSMDNFFEQYKQILLQICTK